MHTMRMGAVSNTQIWSIAVTDVHVNSTHQENL